MREVLESRIGHERRDQERRRAHEAAAVYITHGHTQDFQVCFSFSRGFRFVPVFVLVCVSVFVCFGWAFGVLDIPWFALTPSFLWYVAGKRTSGIRLSLDILFVQGQNGDTCKGEQGGTEKWEPSVSSSARCSRVWLLLCVRTRVMCICTVPLVRSAF